MFNSYEVKAAVFPAALIRAPIPTAEMALFGRSASWQSGGIVIGAALALAYVGRLLIAALGGRRESGLFDTWGEMSSAVARVARADVLASLTHQY